MGINSSHSIDTEAVGDWAATGISRGIKDTIIPAITNQCNTYRISPLVTGSTKRCNLPRSIR